MAKTVMFGDVSALVGDDHVAIVEVRRPPDNFFDAGLISAVADAYQWAGQADARAIVLCSQGKNFCAGADFTGRSAHAGRVMAGPVEGGPAEGGSAEGGPGDAGGVTAGPGETGGVTAGRVQAGGGASDLYREAVRLFEAAIPVVAVVQGAAVGGGLGLACSADFRVASGYSRFSANFARIGLHQGFGLSVTLPAIVGQQAAMDMLYSGRRVGGEEALRMGLADRLADQTDRADHEALRAAGHALASQIAESAPLAVRAIKATLRAGIAGRVRQAMGTELVSQRLLWPTADFAEGVRASAERRAPRFEGR